MLKNPCPLGLHPVGRRLRAAVAGRADFAAPSLGCGFINRAALGEHNSVDAVGQPRDHIAAFNILGNREGVALDRVAKPGAAAERRQRQVALSHCLGHRQRPLVEVAVAVHKHHLRFLGVAVHDGVGRALGDQIEEVGAADVVAVAGRTRVAAPEPGLHRDRAVPHVLNFEERRPPAEPQRFPAGASAEAARPGGRGLDCGAKEDERLVDLPGLEVAHVSLRVEHRGCVVKAVREGLSAAADARHRKVRHRGLIAVLVDAPALECVGRHCVWRQHLL
uniref:Unannotated protein n=1 Tax=freshwater metagenome TaxID=449393 RepID=A0A6J5ZDQ2_9ZZZZ